jgi:hypothetical protein
VEEFRHATKTLAVPVDRFERVLQDLRRLGQVVGEEASGDTHGYPLAHPVVSGGNRGKVLLLSHRFSFLALTPESR